MADVQFSTFGGLAIKQIIRGSATVNIASGGGGSGTATIASVNTAKSAISLITNIAYDSSETGGRVPTCTVALTNSTTVTVTINGLHSTFTGNVGVSFQVIEYY